MLVIVKCLKHCLVSLRDNKLSVFVYLAKLIISFHTIHQRRNIQIYTKVITQYNFVLDMQHDLPIFFVQFCSSLWSQQSFSPSQNHSGCMQAVVRGHCCIRASSKSALQSRTPQSISSLASVQSGSRSHWNERSIHWPFLHLKCLSSEQVQLNSSLASPQLSTWLHVKLAVIQRLFWHWK